MNTAEVLWSEGNFKEYDADFRRRKGGKPIGAEAAELGGERGASAPQGAFDANPKEFSWVVAGEEYRDSAGASTLRAVFRSRCAPPRPPRRSVSPALARH